MSDLRLLDTNPLVYAFCRNRPEHPACLALLQSGDDPKAGLCVSPQILTEFYRVTTSKGSRTDQVDGVWIDDPFSSDEAVAEINKILSKPGISVIPILPDVPARMLELLQRRPVTSRKIFDYQIIATMLAHGVEEIYTYDHGGFGWVAEIRAIRPQPHGVTE